MLLQWPFLVFDVPDVAYAVNYGTNLGKVLSIVVLYSRCASGGLVFFFHFPPPLDHVGHIWDIHNYIAL